ncbi:ABC transporter permease [uncultured Leuconostoc sp.]|uniref:ABC transporter permease n=1 Tax=uncultured Leuconostoc sp. TaxID=173262 RepID=UPI0025F5587F|nr:ABC transporter permease [uncultured Leuconostoc sp.]
MINYWQANANSLIHDTIQHTILVGIALILAILLGTLIITYFLNQNNWLDGITYFFSTLYAIPSYAFFALLIPITGLGNVTAVIVLILYAEYILLRSFITGIREVDPKMIAVAKGIGMTDEQIFIKVQLPLAISSIFSGIRVALTSLIGITTIAATINAGGLGTVLFLGLRQQSLVILLWGTLLTVGLTVVMNFILTLLQYFVTSKIN